MTDVGRRYFGMHNPNLTVHTADARFWLRGAKGPFDAVFVDAYRQPYIPFHLVSREFFGEVADRLGPHGVLMINVGTPPKLTAAVDWIARTMRAEFPAVQQARWNEFNSIVIGYRDPAAAARARQIIASQARGDVKTAGDRARAAAARRGAGRLDPDRRPLADRGDHRPRPARVPARGRAGRRAVNRPHGPLLAVVAGQRSRRSPRAVAVGGNAGRSAVLPRPPTYAWEWPIAVGGVVVGGRGAGRGSGLDELLLLVGPPPVACGEPVLFRAIPRDDEGVGNVVPPAALEQIVLEEVERSGDLEHAVEDSVRQRGLPWSRPSSPHRPRRSIHRPARLAPRARPPTGRPPAGGTPTPAARAFTPHAATMAAR